MLNKGKNILRFVGIKLISDTSAETVFAFAVIYIMYFSMLNM